MPFTKYKNKNQFISDYDLTIATETLLFAKKYRTNLPDDYFTKLLEFYQFYNKAMKSPSKNSEASIESRVMAPTIGVVLSHFDHIGCEQQLLLQHKDNPHRR